MWAVCFHLFSPYLSSLTPFPLPSPSVSEEKAIVQVSVVVQFTVLQRVTQFWIVVPDAQM